MTSLYQIITQLQNTNSTNDKQAILESHQSNESLKWYLKNTYCPSNTFFIADKTYPEYVPTGQSLSLTDDQVNDVLEQLKSRELSGHTAIDVLAAIQNQLSAEDAELLKYMILGDCRIKIGAKSINKVWDKLIINIPYNRCDLLNQKVIDRINKEEVILQLKGDGVFGALVHHDGEVNLYTRNGTCFPSEFANIFKLNTTETVQEGEVVWYDGDTPLERSISNGLSNSVSNGGEMPHQYTPKLLVWNTLSYHEWDSHKSNVDYSMRLHDLAELVLESKNPNVELIETHFVNGMDEVMKINGGYLEKGLEGSVVKFKTAKWAFNTNKEMIKIKVEVEIDLIIESVEEATGKNAGMAGRVNCRSQDGRVVCGINANGSAAERTKLWNEREKVVGKVVTAKCNDIVTSEGCDTYSLFLGRFAPSDIRFDKSEGDDLKRIMQIFESAGVIKKLS